MPAPPRHALSPPTASSTPSRRRPAAIARRSPSRSSRGGRRRRRSLPPPPYRQPLSRFPRFRSEPPTLPSSTLEFGRARGSWSPDTRAPSGATIALGCPAHRAAALAGTMTPCRGLSATRKSARTDAGRAWADWLTWPVGVAGAAALTTGVLRGWTATWPHARRIAAPRRCRRPRLQRLRRAPPRCGTLRRPRGADLERSAGGLPGCRCLLQGPRRPKCAGWTSAFEKIFGNESLDMWPAEVITS